MFANIIFKSIEAGIKLLENAKEVAEFISSTYVTIGKDANEPCIGISGHPTLDLEASETAEFGPDASDFEPNEIRHIVSGISKIS